MPVGAIVGAAGAIGGALISSSAASKASKAQTAAARQGIDAQLAMYNQSREDLTPWRTVGSNALNELAAQAGLPGYTKKADFTKTPGYEFRLSEGTRARNQAAGVGGMFRSGTRGKALEEYGQQFASEEYGKWLGRMDTLAGFGQTANAQQQSSNTQNAIALGDLYGQAGAARASGYVGQANAISGGLNQLSGIAGMYYNQPRG